MKRLKKKYVITFIIAVGCIAFLFSKRNQINLDIPTNNVEKNNRKSKDNTSEKVTDDFRTTLTSIYDESEPDIQYKE